MNVLAIKDGVVLTSNHFSHAMSRIFVVVLEKWPETTDGKVWITAAREDRAAGLHPQDKALDIRTKNIKDWKGDVAWRRAALNLLATKLRTRLGRNYDVVEHSELAGTDNEHIHVEWDEERT